ncbi:M56 family metallopeptidase [Spirosoma sp. SC4-14]|uniref:M56 family metallopeptidase n=1 Tax=Spirosoma sp. SC4-14 TaxID=3128900 RepID=UPI0030D15451
MTTLFTQWFSERQVSAICWTLIHSFWIGLIVAALAGLVITSTRHSSPRLRYRLLCACLILFVMATGVAYYQERVLPEQAKINQNEARNYAPISDLVTRQQHIVSIQTVSIRARLTEFINVNSNWIVAIWLLFFVLKSLRMVSGLVYIERIRSYGVYAPAKEWQQKVESFSSQLGIRQSIALVESQLAKIPVTVGILKPVILVPVGLLTQLPAEQIDTILWHELAHIYRRDYLINLLQSLVETVFFFNPTLLWISALIRNEREICCDDMVLAQTTTKRHYLEALLAFQNNSYQPASYAMPLGFRNQQLMDRLRRMATQENKRLSVAEKIALLSGLLLLLVSIFVSKATPEVHQQIKVGKTKSTTISTGALTATDPIRSVAKPNQTKRQQEREFEQEPVVLSDSNRIFTSILFVNNNHDSVNREMRVKDDQGNRYHLNIANSQLVALEVNDKTIPATDLNQYQNLLQQIDRAMAEKRQQKQKKRDQVIASMKSERDQQLQQDKEAYLTKKAHLEQRSLNGKTEMPASKKLLEPLQNPDKPEKTFSQSKKSGFSLADSLAKVQNLEKKKQSILPDISHDQERVRGVIAALVAEKIVADPSDIDWFGLSTDELIVNGQKQANALQQRLKTQFGIKPNYGLYYGPVKMVGTGIFLDKKDLSR